LFVLSHDFRVVELFHTQGQRCMHQEQPRQDDRKQINNVAAWINISLCYFRFFKLAFGASALDASRFLLILPTNALPAATDTRILALPDLLGFAGLALASVITYTDRKWTWICRENLGWAQRADVQTRKRNSEKLRAHTGTESLR
jgi:hypothetical protein